MSRNPNWKKEFLQIIKILKDNGTDITAIPTKKTGMDKKREFTELRDIKQEGIDIEKIIRDNGLNEDYKIGQKINRFRMVYRGSAKGTMTEEEKDTAEELGVVEKVSSDRQKPLFKGRKISQFHVDIVNEHLSDILSGKLNNREMLELLKQASISENETVIEDQGSIKRIMNILLKDRPEELKKYNQTTRTNSWKKNVRTISINKIGKYHIEQEKFKSLLIDEYLPRYMKGEITLREIEKGIGTSHHTFDKIVKEYYENSKDTEGLELYEKRKTYNPGASTEQRKAAEEMRNEVAQYEVVSNPEFLALTEEEQDKQIIMKIRQTRLKEEMYKEDSTKTIVITEKTARAAVERKKQYFRSKNDPETGVENFSEQDIRYIIFRYPTIISRSDEILDEKFEILTSFDEIDEQTAYGMVKTFPAIAGYAPDRIKSQLDLLKRENLIDSVISSPRRMMQSVNLIYALIQYAKERHGTNDLSDVNRNNIFMPNSTIKRLYGTTYEEIKEWYPYEEERDENNATCTITGENIGKATFKEVSIDKADEASKAVEEILKIRDAKEFE